MSIKSATPNTYHYQNGATWSKSEKAIARTVFDAALTRELQDIMQKAKQMANQIKDPAELWELEHYLTERRKEIVASTTIGTRNSTLYSADFSEKSGSMRESCTA